MKTIHRKIKNREVFIKNFIGGLGWMLGATVGFALLIAVLGTIFRWLGGLPIIGNFIANIIEVTNKAMEVKRGL